MPLQLVRDVFREVSAPLNATLQKLHRTAGGGPEAGTNAAAMRHAPACDDLMHERADGHSSALETLCGLTRRVVPRTE
jgi:hypothetical protein